MSSHQKSSTKLDLSHILDFIIYYFSAKLLLFLYHHPQASINEFSDVEYAKFEAKILVNPAPDRAKRLQENPAGARRHLATTTAIAKVNWTAEGKVTPVKKQGENFWISNSQRSRLSQ